MSKFCFRKFKQLLLCKVAGYNRSDTYDRYCKWFNRFLKDYNLIPKYLRKMGAVYGVVVHEAKNMAHAYTIAGECLRHSTNNHTSPVQNYVVVNYRKRGVPYEQARRFHIYDQD